MSRDPEIVVASRNAKKIGEIRELLDPLGLRVSSVGEHGSLPEVVEDGTTFAENAAKKAVEIARTLEMWTIGEDSGLSVAALGGAPGVYSARFAGESATDAENNAKLIAELAGVPAERRGAFYTCHVVLADPGGEPRIAVEARCHGVVVDTPRGSNGFGYDPHFLVREYGRTFGELSPLVKRCLSHRARAFARFVPLLARLVREETAGAE